MKKVLFLYGSEILKFFKNSIVVSIGLMFFLLTHMFSYYIDEAFLEAKYQLFYTINKNFDTHYPTTKRSEIEKYIKQTKETLPGVDVGSFEFQKQYYYAVKYSKSITGSQILQALILGFLYGFAYLKTIRKVKNNYMPIDVQSFGTFSLTSGGMVLVNGLVPGSFVYLESFLLAGFAVYLHINNTIHQRKYTPD